MRSYQVTVFDTPLEARDQPTPEPTGSEVLVKITAAGVCHSDIHICEGFYDFGGGKKFHMGERGLGLPLTMGHEIAGEIVSAGPDSEPVKAGEPVVVYPWIGCGTCRTCARGDENLCLKPRFLGVYRAGGYATHVIVPHKRYCLPTHGLPADVAAPYACSGVTTWSAIHKIDEAIRQSEPVLIIGAGGLGLMCLSLVNALGMKGAIVADLDEAKRKVALDAGALAAVDPRDPKAVEQVKALTTDGVGVLATIDVVGSGSSVQFAMDCAVKGSHIVVVGLIGGQITIPVPTIPQRAMTIEGSYVGNLSELATLLKFVADKHPKTIPIERLPLAQANAALEALKAGKVNGRIVLQP